MSIPVRLPSASEDRPRWAVLAGIAIACAGIGIALARWGTYGRHAADGDAGGAVVETGSVGDGAEPEAEAEAEVEAEPAVEVEAEPAVEAEAEPQAELAVEAEPELAVEAELADEAEHADGAERTPAVVAVQRRAGALRVVRGRVAYLRCEGVPQQSGPVPCPRDDALEAAAWAAIDSLGDCATPPEGEGEADVVLDFGSASAAPEVRARDRFASDVTRLDGPAVIACVAPALGSVSQTIGSSRLVVSFRFAGVLGP